MIWLWVPYAVMVVLVGSAFYGVLEKQMEPDEDDPIDRSFSWIVAVLFGVIWPLVVAVWVLAHLMMKVRVLVADHLDGGSKLK